MDKILTAEELLFNLIYENGKRHITEQCDVNHLIDIYRRVKLEIGQASPLCINKYKYDNSDVSQKYPPALS
jgi:hypothetical protein